MRDSGHGEVARLRNVFCSIPPSSYGSMLEVTSFLTERSSHLVNCQRVFLIVVYRGVLCGLHISWYNQLGRMKL